MIHQVRTKKLRIIPDERGRLMEILRCDDEIFTKFGQIYLTSAYPGVVKGSPYVYHGFKCVSEYEALVINVPTELYKYNDPDEYRVSPDSGEIPYDWSRKDG